MALIVFALCSRPLTSTFGVAKRAIQVLFNLFKSVEILVDVWRQGFFCYCEIIAFLAFIRAVANGNNIVVKLVFGNIRSMKNSVQRLRQALIQAFRLCIGVLTVLMKFAAINVAHRIAVREVVDYPSANGFVRLVNRVIWCWINRFCHVLISLLALMRCDLQLVQMLFSTLRAPFDHCTLGGVKRCPTVYTIPPNVQMDIRRVPALTQARIAKATLIVRARWQRIATFSTGSRHFSHVLPGLLRSKRLFPFRNAGLFTTLERLDCLTIRCQTRCLESPSQFRLGIGNALSKFICHCLSHFRSFNSVMLIHDYNKSIH